MARTRSTLALATAVVLAAAFAPAVGGTPSALGSSPAGAPEAVPDRGAVLAEPIRRGHVVLEEAGTTAPRPKVVDGRVGDWLGEPTRVSGTSRYDAGELVHSDFLFDAHGADDGGDRARLEQFASLFYAETRTERIDQVLRTSGSQLGVPAPLGAPDEYGDADGGLDVADLHTVRLAASPDQRRLHLLASVTNLTDADRLGVLVLADLHDDGGSSATEVAGTGLTYGRYETSYLLGDDRATFGSDGLPLAVPEGDVPPEPEVVVSADGYENHLEAALPAAFVTDDGTADLALVAGRLEDDGSFTPLNVAFRGDEPVEIHNDRAQAFALLDGTVDAFSSGPVALEDLSDGRTQRWDFEPGGYFERQLTTARPDMAREAGRDGIRQPYGLYVPGAYDPGDAEQALPVTYWLHYRGGKAHSGTVINPRLTTQLGEERGNLVVFPHARGTSEWYVTEAHQDVFDVMDDAEGELFTVDDTRRYVSGYSMGGYGSWLFASLYPDMFAAAFVQSGAVTQGAWVGGGAEGDPVDPTFDQGWVEANDGDARAQLTHRAIENLRHVPFAIDHGTNDELVPITGIERMAEALTRLGYQHRLTRFLGYEHFSQAAVDEWADGAAYLDRFTIDPDPRDVTYSVVPALVHAVNTVDPAQDATFSFAPDGAYWVDGIEVRDVGERGDGSGRPGLDVEGTVQATAHAIEAPATVTVPDPGAASPVDHSTPFVRTGLQQVEDPTGATAPAVSNALTLDLTNVANVAVDSGRAQLEADGATITVTTDGATTVRVADLLAARGAAGHALVIAATGSGGSATARSDGADLVIEFTDAGTATFTLG